MKTKWTLLPMAGLLALLPAAAPAQGTRRAPMVVTNVSGNMHIFQSTPFPCPDLEADVPVIGGRFDIRPAEGFDAGGGNKRFLLTRGTVRMSPFTLDFSCAGRDEHHAYSALSIQVANAVSFLAFPSSPGVYRFVIPERDILLHEAATRNGRAETGDKHPALPVTGTIDLDAGRVSMTVVVGMRIHVDVLGDFDGTLTTTLSGSISFPDVDRDGVPDRADNCPLVANADQSAVASPLIRAPGDVRLPSCLDTRIGRPVAADICESKPVTVSNNAPHPYPLGRTVVTWRARDEGGHVRTDDQRVAIDDTTPPVFTSMPTDILMLDCGPANLGLPTATDDCGGNPALTNDAPARFRDGNTVVTWTATDISGNHAFAAQNVTVDDQAPPAVSCVPGTNPAGNGNGNGGFFRAFASDHCQVVTLHLGSYVLRIGEVIKVTETGQPGVQLIDVMGPNDIRHFRVGRGETVIVATDGSNNTARATCR